MLGGLTGETSETNWETGEEWGKGWETSRG